MRSPDGTYINIGRRLSLTLALLIALFLGGNGLVLSQFARARAQTDRLTSVSQQLIAVLRLQESLLSFHQRLTDLSLSKDAGRLIAEAEPLRTGLLEQARETKQTIAYLPTGLRGGPAFLTALDTIEITLPSQLKDITDLATAGDWEAVRLRLDNELSHIETTTSALVKTIDRDLDEELPQVVANMRDVQRRILIIVPATAISTVCIAAFCGWAIARRILELSVEARVNERTRIARDLHDTLLQSFLGVLMKFETAGDMITDRPADARSLLSTACEQARRAIIEGRDAVQGLRDSTLVSNDLARAIRTLGEGLVTNQTAPQSCGFGVCEEGNARKLAPLVQIEAYRIACEAVRNAVRHAQPSRIDVNVEYRKQELLLRIRDDGKGIDPRILEDGGRAGHYGLPGLRERAKLIGGKLTIWSELGSGTVVELCIPGAAAFDRGPDA